jgi:hypothetical protein
MKKELVPLDYHQVIQSKFEIKRMTTLGRFKKDKKPLSIHQLTIKRPDS